jgi:hypothetical protein
MVKADNRRDYYGDLEVKPDADASDIKKQFKKLGKETNPNYNCKRTLILMSVQRSSTTLIVIPVGKRNSSRNFKQYSPHTKFLQTPRNAPSTMQTLSGQVYFTHTPHPCDQTWLQDLLRPISHHHRLRHAHHLLRQRRPLSPLLLRELIDIQDIQDLSQ